MKERSTLKTHYINNINKDNHKMMADWNSIGRVVIKNSKGIYLKGDGLYFHVNDTVIDLDLAKIFLVMNQPPAKLKRSIFLSAAPS